MKLGLLLGGENTALKDVVKLGAAAEAAGFDSIWCPEFWRSAFVPLATLAGVTSRVRLAPGVSMAFPRSPFLHARFSLDLDELSDGRFICALGTGTLRMNLGWPPDNYPKPVEGLREHVDVVRRLWNTWYHHPGEPVHHAGRYYTVDTPGYIAGFRPLRPDIPVYVAAVLPRMLRLAGEMADGVVGYPLTSPRYLREELGLHLAEGARQASRDPASIEIVPLLVCAVSDDREKARNLARRQLAFYATSTVYRPILERDGFGREWQAIQEASLRQDLEGMERAVSDEMLDALALAGTARECRDKVEKLEGLADLAVLHGPTYGLAREQITESYRSILDAFSG
jgi:probable F420-dependent oxidoreductase